MRPRTAALARPALSLPLPATCRPPATPWALGRITAGLIVALGALTSPAQAAPEPEAPNDSTASRPLRGPDVVNSSLDAQLFYQLLIGEIAARDGDLGTAYQLYLEGAKRQRSAQLFRKAVDIALAGRAGEQALTAARAWRTALPQDRDAAEFSAQILMALGRYDEMAEPVRAMLRNSPPGMLPGLLTGLPRSFLRISDRQRAAQLIDETTEPWRSGNGAQATAWTASAEGWLMAGQPDKARAALQQAQALNADEPAVALVASELMASHPDTEALITAQLARKPQDVVRLAYARRLIAGGRLADGARQLDAVVGNQPENVTALMTLAAVQVELRQLAPAETHLQKLLTLNTSRKEGQPAIDTETIYLLLAQVAELRKKPQDADQWLRMADPQQARIKVQTARARLLVQQGKMQEARQLLRQMPETEPRDGVVKAQAEAQLLKEAQAWTEARLVLQQANQRFPDDPDLMYEQAMVAEQIGQFDEMEALLRKVLMIRPQDASALNALGYSLADRNVRLPEARDLITRALAQRPKDPFITDSLGWLLYREGDLPQALKVLTEAYEQRQDADIGAHIGEVLWQQGDKAGAIRYWKDARQRDPGNRTLKEILLRLKPEL
jgi:tetratricopeptide (TPR) repeat protein